MIKKWLVIVLAVFGFMMPVMAANFEPLIETNNEIVDNQITLKLGFRGEDVQALTQIITYDDNILTLESITPLEDFTFTQSQEYAADDYKRINILVDSPTIYNNIKYVSVTFSLKNLAVGERTRLFFQDYEAAGPNHAIFRSAGIMLTLKRDSSSEMLYLLNNITKNTSFELWLEDNIVKIGLIILGIIVGFVILLNLPTISFKDSPEKKIAQERTKAPAEKMPYADLDLPKKKAEPVNTNADNIFANSGKGTNEASTTKEEDKDKEDLYYFNIDGDAPKKEKDDDNKIEFFLWLLCGSLMLWNINTARALNYDLPSLRGVIVGNYVQEARFDYNQDNEVNVLDIVYVYENMNGDSKADISNPE